MSNLLLQTASIAFISALIGGYLPIRQKKLKHSRWMHHLDAFCDGMFLAIALTHLLPELYTHANHLSVSLAYTVLAAGIAFIIQVPSLKGNSQNWITSLLFAHCLVEGIAVAVVEDSHIQATLSLAILAHKAIESFVFFTLIVRQQWSTPILYLLLIIFSLLTPIGILTGTYLTHFPHHMSLFITALTCGTFLGISINCVLLSDCDQHAPTSRIWMLLGFILLALLMNMVHHH